MLVISANLHVFLYQINNQQWCKKTKKIQYFVFLRKTLNQGGRERFKILKIDKDITGKCKSKKEGRKEFRQSRPQD